MKLNLRYKVVCGRFCPLSRTAGTLIIIVISDSVGYMYSRITKGWEKKLTIQPMPNVFKYRYILDTTLH